MGLFSNRSRLPLDEQTRRATALLDDLERMALSNPGKALKLLRRKSFGLYDAMGLHGTLHARLKKLMERLPGAQWIPEPVPLPDVCVRRWKDWDGVTVGDIVQFAGEMSENVLYCKSDTRNFHNNPALEIAALRFLATGTDALFVGSEDIYFSKAFVLETGAVPDHSVEDIGQEFADYAEKYHRKLLNLF